MSKDRFAIIQNTSHHVEADQRSKDCPGHGYPAHSYTTKTFKESKTREEWEREIQSLAHPKFGAPRQFTAIVFNEARISTQVDIDIP